jgi:hypothetical protein
MEITYPNGQGPKSHEAPVGKWQEELMLQNLPASLKGVRDSSRTRLLADIRSTHSLKIRELGQALIATGFLTLDEQAKALGVPRSTAWTIVAARHKKSGLSAKLITRMLASQSLPPLVRAKIIEYREEKTAGLYGGTTAQRARFSASLANAVDHQRYREALKRPTHPASVVRISYTRALLIRQEVMGKRR